ncbi:MAG: periplasmic heavy metal sensor [Candidatus Krumholzibacteria bacterium]|nr:periplasmic heavy metal sensor [Candidatus Krumholzibacteria bacterium]
MRKGSFIVTAVLVAALLPVFLFAQGGQMKMKDGDKPHCESMQKLDPEVSLKIEKLRVDLKLKNLDLQKKQAGIHEQMFKEFTSENPNRKNIDKLAGEMRDVQAALMSNRHDFMFEVRKLVSADQFKIFMEHRGCGMGDGCGMGGEGGRGCMMGKGDHKCSMGMGAGCCAGGEGGRGCMMGKGDHKCSMGQGGSGCCSSEGMGAGRCGGKEMKCEMKTMKTMGCGHADKSMCSDECLKKCEEVKVIEKVIEKK